MINKIFQNEMESPLIFPLGLFFASLIVGIINYSQKGTFNTENIVLFISPFFMLICFLTNLSYILNQIKRGKTNEKGI